MSTQFILFHPIDATILAGGFSNLDIVCHLGIEIWDFSPISVEESCFYLSGLMSTLTLPWNTMVLLDTPWSFSYSLSLHYFLADKS
jgi:hypothetical protein